MLGLCWDTHPGSAVGLPLSRPVPVASSSPESPDLSSCSRETEPSCLLFSWAAGKEIRVAPKLLGSSRAAAGVSWVWGPESEWPRGWVVLGGSRPGWEGWMRQGRCPAFAAAAALPDPSPSWTRPGDQVTRPGLEKREGCAVGCCAV